MTFDPAAAVVLPDPYPIYRRLAFERPVGRDHTDTRWVVAGDAAVAAVLGDARFTVRPPDDAGPAALVAALARTADGARHERLRAATVGCIAPVAPADVRARAERVATELGTPDAPLDAAGLDRLIVAAPLVTVARALGVHVPGVDELVALVGRVARGLAVPLPADAHGDVVAAADELVARTGGWPVAALLVQTLDATAGLVGNSLVAAARHGAPDDVVGLVHRTALADPAVHTTRRWAAAPVEVRGHRIAAGAEVVVLLASTTTPFGTGAHRCPGDDIALAVAAGAVSALRPASAHLAAAVRAPAYRRRPNVRIPWFAGGRPG